MLLPSFLYGRFSTVKAACRKHVAAIRKGATLHDLVDTTLDTATTPGLIAVEGPSPLLGGGDHFHTFAMIRLLREATPPFDAAAWDALFAESLESSWGLLGLLSQSAQVLLRDKARHAPFLKAMTARWDEFDAVGPRYAFGGSDPTRLWNIPMNLKHVLANQGVPVAALKAPLPPGGIQALLGH